jgi:translation initiation factor IF-3
MIGVVSLDEALRQAKEASLDLVEISPTSEPPVCKILDFSRYKYNAKKKLQEAKKKQKKTVLKEMKFKVNIGQGDLDIKLRKIREFLEEGDKVKISLWFKGREIMHREKGEELFEKIIANLESVAKIDSEPKMEGKQVIMIVSPLSSVQ